MKKLYFLMVTLLVTSLSFGQDLILTGVFDGPLSGGTPKVVEMYVANDIADLSVYGVSSANNGTGATGAPEFSFSGSATSGQYLYVTANDSEFTTYFGFTADFVDSVANINGDDAVELFFNGNVIDVFGDVDVDGTGQPWEHLDGWAYRIDGSGPDGSTFELGNWTYSGINAIDGCSDNASCLSVFPIGTYSTITNTNPNITITSPLDGESLPSGTTDVDIAYTVANAPGATVNLSYTVNGGSSIDDTNVSNPYTIPGLSDGDLVAVSVELIDGGVLATDALSFSISYPCDLQVGTITATCNDITPASDDTYNVSIDYTGGGTTIYTIDTGGVGVVTGDNPTSVADGTIEILNVTEGTDFVVTFTGDPANSSCDFTRIIDSPNCDPQLVLPQYDSFSYADGPLVGNSEWQVTGSSSSDDLLVTSGQALVQHGTPSQDVNLPFTSVTGDLFYAFDMTVQDPGAPISGSDNEYFAHFKDSGFGFSARLDIVPPSGGGDFSVGIATSGGAADATWATDLTYGTTYRVTVRYDQDANFAELWVDASLETDTSILGADEDDMNGDTIEAFGLRQSDSDLNEGILIDNLAITETFSETLSNEEFTITGAFKVYPNPTSLGFVNIVSTNNNALSVAVYDILGKEVINTALTNNKLNVSELNSGVYIMKISQNNATVTKKLIIK